MAVARLGGGGSSTRSGGGGCGGWPRCTGAHCGGFARSTPRRSWTSSRAMGSLHEATGADCSFGTAFAPMVVVGR
jgi:hypothetical protein